MKNRFIKIDVIFIEFEHQAVLTLLFTATVFFCQTLIEKKGGHSESIINNS